MGVDMLLLDAKLFCFTEIFFFNKYVIIDVVFKMLSE